MHLRIAQKKFDDSMQDSGEFTWLAAVLFPEEEQQIMTTIADIENVTIRERLSFLLHKLIMLLEDYRNIMAGIPALAKDPDMTRKVELVRDHAMILIEDIDTLFNKLKDEMSPKFLGLMARGLIELYKKQNVDEIGRILDKLYRNPEKQFDN